MAATPWLLCRAREHWLVIAVLVLFAGTALIVPTLAPVWVADDWLYARSVRILLHDHELRIMNLAVATGVFQVVWGALFAAPFGLTPGVLRVSTLVLSALGGLGAYGLCRELGVKPGASALATALVLFAPLAYVLEFSFMSDAQFTALLVLSTYLYARGEGRSLTAFTLAGSVVAAMCFLVRQQGVLIPVAVLTWLVLSGRLRQDGPGLRTAARVAGIPAVACSCYYLWITFVHGVPSAQRNLFVEIGRSGWNGMADITARMVFVEAMYIGLFVLPVSVAAVVGAGRSLVSRSWRAWLVGAAWAGVVVIGLLIFAADVLYMPYVPQFLAPWGLGPSDLHGGRPTITGETFEKCLTGAAAASTVVFGYLLGHRFLGRAGAGRGQPGRGVGGLVLAVAAWQAVGAIPPSLHYRIPFPAGVLALSLDRYLLPLLPLGVCLALWAVAEWHGPALWPAWAFAAAFGVVSVVGTRDYLVFQRRVHELADELHRSGIPKTRLDAGAQWTGEKLYDDRPENPPPNSNRTWWVNFFAPDTDPAYVISTEPLPGYDLMRKVPYSVWLSSKPAHLLVLRRTDAETTAAAR
ncbi:MAG: glycosyltransferase family 39 protein [Actinomycetota bacterium]|nr:glycosyltransferase family 39 protein [Actinomycetota bacterium]